MKKLPFILLLSFSIRQASAQSEKTIVKIDTTQYVTSSYDVPKGSKVDQLLNLMDGFAVDPNGIVSHQGKQVNKVVINGRHYMGLDVARVVKELPANVVGNIEMIDDYGDSAYKVGGSKSGDPNKTLNINIKKGRMDEVRYALYSGPRNQRGLRPGIYEDPAIYGDMNDANEHNPLNRRVNRAIRSMLAISDQLHEVDEYGDQIPHFLIPTPYPMRYVTLKRDVTTPKNQVIITKP